VALSVRILGTTAKNKLHLEQKTFFWISLQQLQRSEAQIILLKFLTYVFLTHNLCLGAIKSSYWQLWILQLQRRPRTCLHRGLRSTTKIPAPKLVCACIIWRFF